MTNFDMPVGLTDEALNDNGVSRLFTEVVPCSAIEFHDRESVTVNGTSLFISQDEAVPELGVFTGLGRGKTLAKLPDELFAYDLNYLFRRSEADASIVYDENGTMVGVNMADLFRLSTSYLAASSQASLKLIYHLILSTDTCPKTVFGVSSWALWLVSFFPPASVASYQSSTVS